jgi:hypothetical protein
MQRMNVEMDALIQQNRVRRYIATVDFYTGLIYELMLCRLFERKIRCMSGTSGSKKCKLYDSVLCSWSMTHPPVACRGVFKSSKEVEDAMKEVRAKERSIRELQDTVSTEGTERHNIHAI